MKHWILWLIAGIVLVIGGILALTNPFGATLLATAIAAWSFIIGGVLQLYGAFTQKEGNKLWPALAGAAGLLVGIALFKNPLAGVMSLTVLVAMMFFVIGLTKIFAVSSLKGTQAYWPVMISGFLSVVLAIMIFTNFPYSAVAVLGILLAVELLSSGISLIMMSLSNKTVTA